MLRQPPGRKSRMCALDAAIGLMIGMQIRITYAESVVHYDLWICVRGRGGEEFIMEIDIPLLSPPP